MRKSTQIFTIILCLGLNSCGFNAVIDVDEEVKGAFAEMDNQYKRRADLVPNLIATVKGASNFEQETLIKVVQARSAVGSMRVDSSILDDPQKLQAFESKQQQLSGALSRLLVVAEKYPELKATQTYQTLLTQLEGTENRIAVARRRYIEAVAHYNKTILNFPTLIGAWLRGKQVRPTFSGDPAAQEAPKVSF